MNAADLAGRLDLDKLTNSWRGDCPACAYPRVFSVKAGKNDTTKMYCSNGCSREAVADAVERRLGTGWKAPPPTDPEHEAAARARKLAAAERLWLSSDTARFGPVARYLASRGLAGLEQSQALRWRGDCHHPEGGRLNAMVAQVVDAADKPLGVHRTYLNRDGSAKASVMPDRASLGPVWGGAVRLHALGDLAAKYDAPDALSALPDLVIGEGVESAASAGLLLNLPAWAALSAGNLAKGLILPASVRHVIIAADNDPRARNGHWPGQEAAQAAQARWRAEGRAVRIAMPDRRGDFNDVLQARADA